MQQRRQQQGQQRSSQRLFTASEVAEFEYCPLAWWHEKYEPYVEADTEELFAHMVELEHEHGTQATALPEYQVLEQLLVRRGAFEDGRQRHKEHAEEVAEIEEEQLTIAGPSRATRILVITAIVIVVLALLFIIASFVITIH